MPELFVKNFQQIKGFRGTPIFVQLKKRVISPCYRVISQTDNVNLSGRRSRFIYGKSVKEKSAVPQA